MDAWIYELFAAIVLLTATICGFFFATTRGALLVRALAPGSVTGKSHVYPIYSDMRLIKLVDRQPIISAILLFQYHRLVSKIVAELAGMDLRGRSVLITSCAFGNVIPRVVAAAIGAGAERVIIVDIIRNELVHARGKLGEYAERVELLEEDATAMRLGDGLVAANVVFFLLHELPDHLKTRALAEAGRTLATGGKLLLADFHKPRPWVLRALSWTYFTVFEPLGLALWSTHDPRDALTRMGGWRCEQKTYLHGNFQVVTATREQA
jgi:ubiquinone/menaquinone biosynthesis C-methylase UbiE